VFYSQWLYVHTGCPKSFTPPLLSICLLRVARVNLLIAKHFAQRPLLSPCFAPGIKYLPGLRLNSVAAEIWYCFFRTGQDQAAGLCNGLHEVRLTSTRLTNLNTIDVLISVDGTNAVSRKREMKTREGILIELENHYLQLRYSLYFAFSEHPIDRKTQ
jgi:hypothetical protein